MPGPALVEDVRVVPVSGDGCGHGDHVGEGEQAPAKQATTPVRDWRRHLRLSVGQAGAVPRYCWPLDPRGGDLASAGRIPLIIGGARSDPQRKTLDVRPTAGT